MAADGVAGLTQADPDTLIAVSKKMSTPLQTLEGHLKSLAGSQGTLQTAFKGNAGDAVYNAFGNVLTTGSKVAEYIEQIMQEIIAASSKFDEEDRLAMQGIANQLGDAGDGVFNAGTTGATGGWATDQLENTQGPSKADINW
ncbi:WXG100 family type VII secretion target [Nocardia sp. NPDC003963]